MICIFVFSITLRLHADTQFWMNSPIERDTRHPDIKYCNACHICPHILTKFIEWIGCSNIVHLTHNLSTFCIHMSITAICNRHTLYHISLISTAKLNLRICMMRNPLLRWFSLSGELYAILREYVFGHFRIDMYINLYGEEKWWYSSVYMNRSQFLTRAQTHKMHKQCASARPWPLHNRLVLHCVCVAADGNSLVYDVDAYSIINSGRRKCFGHTIL